MRPVLLSALAVASLFLSCDGDKKVKPGLELLRSRPVVLKTDSMRCLVDGRDTAMSLRQDAMTFVVYTDSSVCSTCRLKNIHLWDDILEEAKVYGDALQFCFIFAPKKEDMRSFELVISTYSPECPVFVDTMGVFERSNRHIPNDESMHAFLLDRDGNVLLVGSPLDNKRVKELFHKVVRERIKNE